MNQNPSTKEVLEAIEKAKQDGKKEVFLANLGLTEIPAELLQEMPDVEVLWLTFNQLTEVRLLSNFPNLKKLYLDSNQISDISPLSSLTNLEILSLQRNHTEAQIEQQVMQKRQIQQNNTPAFSYSQLDINPISGLYNLKELYLDENQLNSTEGLKYLTNLEVLSLNTASLGYDYSGLGELTKLRYLYLSNTNQSDISFLANLKNLYELDLTRNQIKDISPLQNATSLRLLYLSYNLIEDIAPLASLKNCIKFDLSHNQIKDLLPLSWAIRDDYAVVQEASELGIDQKGIAVADNPWELPTAEIVFAGGNILRNYLIEYEEKEQITNKEIKLILVGNSTSGKSSLSRMLRTGDFDTQEPTTHGIRNEKWQPKDTNIKVQVWDFGGQEYYHATHRLFLSNRAVYVVIWDSGTHEGGLVDTKIFYEDNGNKIEKIEQLEHFSTAYWLDTIRFYAPDSPIFVVQNKIDYFKPLSFSDEMISSFSLNTEHVFSVSLKAASEIPFPPENDKALAKIFSDKFFLKYKLLETMLSDELDLTAKGFFMSKYWNQVRQEIETLPTTIEMLSLVEFEQICLKYEPNPQLELLLFYLKDMLGLVLYYGNHPTLKEKIFLRPNDIHANIYKILNYKVKGNQGKFDFAHIKEVLACDDAKALDYAHLMQLFELIFETEKDKFVAPQYLASQLDAAQLHLIQNFMNLEMGFVLHIPSFLPRSVIARFIAQKGLFAQNGMYWKYGILYKENNLSILVEADYQKNTISVQVTKANIKEKNAVLASVWATLQTLIGKPNHWELSADGSDFVSLNEILQADKYGALKLLTKDILLESFRFLLHQKPKNKANIFIAYAAQDENTYKDELEKHLSNLIRKDLIQTWDIADVAPGQDIDAALEENLENAQIILLLVSADFMADAIIWEKVLQKALQKYQSGQAIVLPIYLRPCDIEDWDFGNLQFLPRKKDKDGHQVPISKMDKDEAFVEVVAALRERMKG